jgi:hypothetical protein
LEASTLCHLTRALRRAAFLCGGIDVSDLLLASGALRADVGVFLKLRGHLAQKRGLALHQPSGVVRRELAGGSSLCRRDNTLAPGALPVDRGPLPQTPRLVTPQRLFCVPPSLCIHDGRGGGHVGATLARIRPCFPLVGDLLALVGDLLALVGDLLALVGDLLALVRRLAALKHGRLPLPNRPTPLT